MTDTPKFLGVPFEYAIITCIVPVQVAIFTGLYFIGGTMFFLMWIVGIVMTKKDPRWVEVVKTILKNKKTAPNLFEKEKRYIA